MLLCEFYNFIMRLFSWSYYRKPIYQALFFSPFGKNKGVLPTHNYNVISSTIETLEFQSMIDEWCLRRTKALIADQLPQKGKAQVIMFNCIIFLCMVFDNKITFRHSRSLDEYNVIITKLEVTFALFYASST